MDVPSGVVMRCEARGFAFDVHADDELRDTVHALFEALERRTDDAVASFAVHRASDDGRRWHVRMDGKLMMACELRGEALHGLMVYINQRVVMARDDLLSIHAAGVATPDGAVLLPGNAGNGKTTLCARLLQRGAAYLSDDSVALDRGGRLLGYPKPLGFKVGTWVEFAEAGLADLDLDPGTQLVWQVPPGRLGATVVTVADPVAVVLPRFDPGAPLRVEPLSRQAGAAAILQQVQNLPAFGVPDALEVIGQLLARVPCHAVVYGDARDAVPAVLDRVAPPTGEAAAYQVFPPIRQSVTMTQPVPAGDLSALCFEDGALLVRGESGEFLAVDRVAAVVWPLLDGRRSVEAISAEVATLFDAPASQVSSDISRWVDELVESGFLLLR
jgi:hypothetical protein